MHESSISYLRCINCNSKLDCDVFCRKNEIIEGMLICKQCDHQYPIIKKIPILWNSFENYLSVRPSLGGYFFNSSTNTQLKKFIKTSLRTMKKTSRDQSLIERRWTKIYQQNKSSKFYSTIYKKLSDLKNLGFVLEYGCSIGTLSSKLTNIAKRVFGIDVSFSSIEIAKNTFNEKLDYFVTDSMFSIFGKNKFDTVLALNILELVEPTPFFKKLSFQTKELLLLTSPYDYDRGINSVRHPVYEKELRNVLREMNFSLVNGTRKPSEISWNLKLNKRCFLNYYVDLVIGKRNNLKK